MNLLPAHQPESSNTPDAMEIMTLGYLLQSGIDATLFCTRMNISQQLHQVMKEHLKVETEDELL